ncbi:MULTISPECIES: MerR family transcriptional regulator [unclassified Burkholderia]|uniref:MerR family transcriptional regulator n=1 Tax=unclassified Burkholderia TaxID=2613784 RepID=UPI00084CDF27|nr:MULTISPECIES: MerR family transcriptional regulator [unclassified Burkholderia]RQU15579.1 MerR family transcriptional regulator [Burkholderia cenocepacia]MBR8238946.1 MerR family transcriptional regulator [Burkholderia sp. AU32357]MBY4876910.1 MerR family transcriptional regulator [Burkholderia sp. AU42008]OED08871.1 MerR family transcriptional regulator [Burkholderia sp. A2]OXI45355.1 MerR family transcriptional regulator [Burkholderia sp. AU17457]
MSKTVSQPSAAGPLTIGQVAELTGVSTHTLRYYEQAGLLRAISRTAAGHRLYAPADLDWLAFVMRLKATGMPIAQMQAFAVLREQGASTFGARRDLLVAHRDAVRAHIAELQASLDAIGDKIAYYEAQERETERRATPSHSLSEQDGHDGTTR